MRNRVLVVGSIAYDVVFEVHNNFSDEIIVEENAVKSVSMMLTAKNKKIFFGGTGGNIAYGLGLQKVNPILFSVVGEDFNADYKKHLSSHGVDIRVVEKPGEFTATFYGISDSQKQQIGIFQPNTHGDYMDTIHLQDKLTPEDFTQIKIAIFSPGTGVSTYNHLKEFRELAGNEPTVIFDPSQVLSIFFTPELLKKCLKMSNIFMGNETEVAQLTTILGMPVEEVLNFGLKYVIETRGKEGSIIHSKAGKKLIKPVKTENFVEQTGAGDAYRAGLIRGLLENKSIEESCQIGSIMGAKNIQTEGGQKYRLDN